LIEGKAENIVSLIANLPPLLYTTFHWYDPWYDPIFMSNISS
jgi:hypothetical protein